MLGIFAAASLRSGQAKPLLPDSASAEPDSARATYERAIVSRDTGNYHDAREGFLRVLQLDPTFADARFQLALLTYSRGALLETQHHVDAFAASFPSDPRVAELRKMVVTPPPRRAMTLGP